MGCQCLQGTLSPGEDGKVLETDDADVCPTTRMYLLPLSCALKMVTMVTILCYAYFATINNNYSIKIEKCFLVNSMPDGGLEFRTSRSRVACSSDRASRRP